MPTALHTVGLPFNIVSALMTLQGATSDYQTSASRTVINNQPPVISGSNANLGTKSEGFTQTYTVTDADNDSVTVDELLDDKPIRSYVVTCLGKQIPFM